MTTPAQTQLDDDVREIYDMLKPVAKTLQQHSRQLAGLDGKIDQLGERLDGFQQELTHLGGGQLRQGGRLNQLDRNVMAVNERLDAVDGRFERVEDRLTIVEEKLDRQDRKLDEHGTKLDDHSSKLDQILDLLRPGRAETP